MAFSDHTTILLPKTLQEVHVDLVILVSAYSYKCTCVNAFDELLFELTMFPLMY